ncbi:hypothetical protein D3C72_707850 [compost metagenome]
MEYAFAALVVIGVIFLVIFNIRTSRRVREQQERTEGQGSGEAAALSDRAVRPAADDPARLDPTVMQINEILEPVAESRLEDEPELHAPGMSTKPNRGAARGQVAEPDRGAATEQIVEPDRKATSDQIGKPEPRATTEQIAEQQHIGTSEQIAKPQQEPERQSDLALQIQPEPQAGSHDQVSAAHRDDSGAAVDKLLSRTGTTSRDEQYRRALRQMAEPEQAVKQVPEGDDDAGDKAYREALRSILERKSADHSERGSKNE